MFSCREGITRRKDGRFMGRFIIGRREDGRALYQYVYGSTYEETEQKLIIGREIEERFRLKRDISVNAAYEEWLCAVSHRVKRSSLASYRGKFERHILPSLGSRLCRDLAAAELNAFISDKLAEGLCAGYVRDIITVLKMMLRYAEEEYGFKLSLKNVTLPRREGKRTKSLTQSECARLSEHLKSNMGLTEFGVLIALAMGLRIGELCGLRWGDVDLENAVIHINRTVQRVSVTDGGSKTRVIVSSPKSKGSKRSIAIPNELMGYFRRFKAGDECYILSACEKPTEPRTMQYRYKRILERAAVEGHNFHLLRHTFATACAERGFDIKTLSVILGHSSVKLTLERYVHPNMEHERRLMNSLHLLS